MVDKLVNPCPENGAEVDRTACGPGAGRGRVRRNVHRHVRQDLPPALSVPRIPRTNLDDRAGFAGPDAAGRHSLHRAGGVHPEHPAARDRRGRPVRGGHGVRHHHPARSRGDGAGGGGRRRDRDLRRPRRPHHPRGDRRDAGARHRPDPAARRPARARLHRRRAAAERSGVRDRARRRLRLLRLPPGRQPRRVHQWPDRAHRPRRVGARGDQGFAVRRRRRAGRAATAASPCRAGPRASAPPSTKPSSTPSSVCSSSTSS